MDAQRALKTERASLKKWEDSLQQYSIQIVEGKNPSDRFTADSIFTKILVRALIKKNSFYYKLFIILNCIKINKNSKVMT
jgi:hypothetical protein